MKKKVEMTRKKNRTIDIEYKLQKGKPQRSRLKNKSYKVKGQIVQCLKSSSEKCS